MSWTGSQPANPSSSGDVLTGVSAQRPCDVWAVGYYLKNRKAQPLFAHWNGQTWKAVTAPSLDRPSVDDEDPGSYSQLSAVAASSPTNVWAVGSYKNGRPSSTFAIHCC